MKKSTKLALRHETVRNLVQVALAHVRGGAGASEYPLNCQTEVCNPSGSGGGGGSGGGSRCRCIE